MRHLIKKILHPFLKLGADRYYAKPRIYRYEGIEVLVEPSVFPPHLTISTKILLEYLKTIDLKEKSLLELGCGSGIISLFTASKGAIVTASDINTIALKALTKASEKNQLPIITIYSDLFTDISTLHFDYIIINPPYYPNQPKNIKEQAWFCGENFEYFERLFLQLSKYVNPSNNILMILSEDCQIKKINDIAHKNNLLLQCILEKKVISEKNYIFKILINEKVD
ncbi:methyltransferase [uncultured Aquimarina sp.]|uniref:methyltransferase n=1 Tax=uncultured Aquimarina sp. TaxID=575652 RepID=UPI0026258CC3|nr:methyltransferase [uncultured Aquimarina sp.]